MIGLALGFLLAYWMLPPKIETKVDVVTEYITVETMTEVMPLLNCPNEQIKTPETNGELLLAYKRLIDWRANCLNSIQGQQ